MLTAEHKGHMIGDMSKLESNSRAGILHLLCEGQSIRAATPLTGASKNTVARLLNAGRACPECQDRFIRNWNASRA